MINKILINKFQQGPNVEVVVLSDKKNKFIIELKKSPTFCLRFASDLGLDLYKEFLWYLEEYGLKKIHPVQFLPKQKLPTFSERAVEALKGGIFRGKGLLWRASKKGWKPSG